MKRRNLFKYLGATGASVILSSCGADMRTTRSRNTASNEPLTNPQGQSNPQCQSTNIIKTDSGHSHNILQLDPAIVNARTVGSYRLLTGSHSHNFRLSTQDFDDLRAGKTIEIFGDEEGHGHSVRIGCVFI